MTATLLDILRTVVRERGREALCALRLRGRVHDAQYPRPRG